MDNTMPHASPINPPTHEQSTVLANYHRACAAYVAGMDGHNREALLAEMRSAASDLHAVIDERRASGLCCAFRVSSNAFECFNTLEPGADHAHCAECQNGEEERAAACETEHLRGLGAE